MTAFADLLTRHVPYASRHRDHVTCLTCLDPETGGTCGEFTSAADWARHVEQACRDAGLSVGHRLKRPEPEQMELL